MEKIYLVTQWYTNVIGETFNKPIKAFAKKVDAENFVEQYNINENPLSEEQEKEFKKIQETLYYLMDNDNKFDSMSSKEIDDYRYLFFEQEGFSKPIVEAYDEYCIRKLNKYYTVEIVEFTVE